MPIFTRRPVLYVEDHPVNALLMAAILERRPELELIIATTGEEALCMAAGLQPALLLLDLGLPDCHGIALLRRLRAAGHALPAVLITARDSLQDRLAGFDGGADDYLIKEFDIPELLARLRAVVRRAGGAQADSVWQVGDLTLDARSMHTTCRGAPVNLSRTEFALLHALVRNPDRIVTRMELEQGVLPYSEGQTLDVHISNLRKKIGDGYIRTVRGVGYMVRHDGGR